MSDTLLPKGIEKPKDIDVFWNGKDDINIKEFNSTTDNSLALNSIPMPFARAKVVEQAFRIVAKDGWDVAGNVFCRLVSDCLDVFEILYNYDSYKEEIEIIHSKISELKFAEVNEVQGRDNQKKNVSLLHSSLKKYPDYDNIYFIVLKRDGRKMVLAATCPETVFFTTSRLDRTNREQDYDKLAGKDFIFPKADNNGYFFSRERAKGVRLEDRSEDFRKYMYRLYDNNRMAFRDTAIGDYLQNCMIQIQKSDFTYLKSLQDNVHDEVFIGLKSGLAIDLHYNGKPKGNRLFYDHVLNIGYPVNSGKYKIMTGNHPELKSSLFPINMDVVTELGDAGKSFMESTFRCNLFKIETPEGIQSNVEQKKCPIKFDMGVYPFIKFPENYSFKRYYITLAYKYEGDLPKNAVECIFYQYDGDKVVRINKDEGRTTAGGYVCEMRTDKDGLRSLHYTLSNVNFDFIEIRFRTPVEEYRGTLIPTFDVPSNPAVDGIITFAVDFGTTSTFVAEKVGSGEAFTLKTPVQSMVYLHQEFLDNNSVNNAHKYELPYINSTFDGDLLKLIRNEFLPSFIDDDVYKFPIRTAVSKHAQENDLFSKINIGFMYEKERGVGENFFEPNLKWNLTRKTETEAFIKELLILAVNKAFLEGYGLHQIKFIRFKPLSLSSDLSKIIDAVWEKSMSEMGLPESRVVTESYAPYYFYSKQCEDNKTVATIDIGGGSVDFVIFSDGEPQYASSALFGCDVLWGSGKIKTAGDKTNGVYQILKDNINIKDPEIRMIQQEMMDIRSPYSSADIINFWITNNDHTNVSTLLKLSTYHPLYIAHLSAIIYHIAQTMKYREVDDPLTALAFSGNGSKYMDIFTETKVKKIAEVIFAKVFGDKKHVAKHLQVIKPPTDISGKEITAYGGLKINFDKFNQRDMDEQEFVYLGLHPDNEGKWKNKYREDILNTKAAAMDGICSNVHEFLTCLEAILRDGDILTQQSIKYQPEAKGSIRTSLLDIISNGDILGKDTKIRSSLFFLPLHQTLYTMAEQIKKNQ